MHVAALQPEALIATLKGSRYVVRRKGSRYVVRRKGSRYVVRLKGSPYVVRRKGSPYLVPAAVRRDQVGFGKRHARARHQPRQSIPISIQRSVRAVDDSRAGALPFEE